MREHEELLDEIVMFGASAGSPLDVGCFIGMLLGNDRKRGFEIAGIEPNWDAVLHVRNLMYCDVVQGAWHPHIFHETIFLR
jgi:hypothetical protein